MNRVELAALNNVHLYEKVCAAHGCQTTSDEDMLLCSGTPPRFYGQAVTLRPGISDVVEQRVTGGFKDSFADITPDPRSYRLLFEAQWIWAESSTDGRLSFEWKKVETSKELEAWEAGWAFGDDEAADFPVQFPASLLEEPDFSFWGAYVEAKLVAGAILNSTPPVVGVSNVFVLSGSALSVWKDLRRVCGPAFPGLNLVGYEREESLAASIGAGFVVTGPLRVWVPV